MSALSFVFSSNLMHADMSKSATRRWFSSDMRRVLSCVREIPCSVALEGLDCEISPDLRQFRLNSGKAQVLSGEFAHVISDWANERLALANFRLWGEVSHPVQFVAEYSIPSRPVVQSLVRERGEVAFFLLDSWTRLYSLDFSSLEMPISASLPDEVNTLEYEGAVLLRMHSQFFEPILDAWYAYQAIEEKALLDHVENTIRKALRRAEQQGTPVVFVPIDLETCVIGSHIGAATFEAVIERCVQAGFPLVTPQEVYGMLRGQARHTELRPGRSTPKWEGYWLQHELMRGWLDASANLPIDNDLAMKLCLIGGGSDGLVVVRYRSGHKQHSTKTSTVPIMIGGDNEPAYLLQQCAIGSRFEAETMLEKIQLGRRGETVLDLVGGWLSDQLRLCGG